MYRKAILYDYFYPENSDELSSFMEEHKYIGEKVKASLIIVPHAGYIYSGKVAVKTISKATFSNSVIILGVNHTGFGENISVWDKGAWQTPFGDVEVDEKLAADLIKITGAKSDVVAHAREHSIETVMPILKYFHKDTKVVPISMMGMAMSKIKSFASDLSYFVKEGYSIIVSSDFNHYENEQITNVKDFLAIEHILNIDGKSLYDTVMEKGVSMCGVYPATAALMALKDVAKKAELVEHTTSAEYSGDYNQVVGYAGVIIG